MRTSLEKPPQGYRLKERIDLTRNRRQLRLVVGISLAWIAVGLIAGFWLEPRLGLLVSGGFAMAIFRLLVMCLAIVLYIGGHEAVHGLFMWLYSRKKPSFGFTLMYAYAGSRAYFGKYAYLSIALAPVVLWGAALTVLVKEIRHNSTKFLANTRKAVCVYRS